jgi:hypothetical protein
MWEKKGGGRRCRCGSLGGVLALRLVIYKAGWAGLGWAGLARSRNKGVWFTLMLWACTACPRCGILCCPRAADG